MFTPRNLLLKSIAAAAAALLVACGGGGSSHHPTTPPPAGVTYDVIELIKDPTALISVTPTGINELDMVAGVIAKPAGPSRAFLYNGTSVIDLGDFGGASSQAFGINRCGNVAGWALGPKGDIPQAFKYEGTLRNLGTPGRFSRAIALNDCDKVVGAASFGGAPHAFLYDGTMHDLGTLGGARSEAQDVNASGVVTGGSLIANTVHAFVYDRSTGTGMKDLGTLGGARSFSRAINDAGQITGASDNKAGQLRAFRYAGGVLKDLGTLPGGDSSEGVEINVKGYVIGTSTLSGNHQHGFMHDGVTMHDIGTLGNRFSEALAINASAVVVGSSVLPVTSEERAISWTLAGGIVNLNSRLHSPPAGLVLIRAMAVNNKGTIVATSNTGLVLLKPRP